MGKKKIIFGISLIALGALIIVLGVYVYFKVITSIIIATPIIILGVALMTILNKDKVIDEKEEKEEMQEGVIH